jgi:hypothetical protein
MRQKERGAKMINILAIAPPRRRVRYQIIAENSHFPAYWRKDSELAKPWKRFTELCRQLEADRFNFQVSIRLQPPIPPAQPGGYWPKEDQVTKIVVEITGSAGRGTIRKAPRRARITPPQRKTAEYCAKQRVEAEKRITTAAAPLEPAEYESAIADVEYWRELESLAETRDQSKPGLGPDVDKSDTEVRAA